MVVAGAWLLQGRLEEPLGQQRLGVPYPEGAIEMEHSLAVVDLDRRLPSGSPVPSPGPSAHGEARRNRVSDCSDRDVAAGVEHAIAFCHEAVTVPCIGRIRWQA